MEYGGWSGDDGRFYATPLFCHYHVKLMVVCCDVRAARREEKALHRNYDGIARARDSLTPFRHDPADMIQARASLPTPSRIRESGVTDLSTVDSREHSIPSQLISKGDYACFPDATAENSESPPGSRGSNSSCRRRKCHGQNWIW